VGVLSIFFISFFLSERNSSAAIKSCFGLAYLIALDTFWIVSGRLKIKNKTGVVKGERGTNLSFIVLITSQNNQWFF